MELDFSKLEGISYRGIDGEAARAEKDKLIEQGFTIIEGEKTPFDAPPAKAEHNPAQAQRGRLNRKFTGIDEGRDYRAMYRAACNYHEQHNPPVVDREYWRTHQVGKDEVPQAELEYWEKAAIDIAAVAHSFGNDPFITGLLTAIYNELGREYKTIAGGSA